MPEWLDASLSGTTTVTPAILAWRIGCALVLGIVVAGICRFARRGEPVAATFLTTLVMLSALIAMATQVIGDNVARAFSLVGALSVVRFRTVVKDTQDTAFVIFAVVVGMAAGSSHLAVALIGLVLFLLVTPLLWPRRRADPWYAAESKLSMRVALAEGTRTSAELRLGEECERFALTSASTAKQGSCLDLTYRVRLRPGVGAADLVAGLDALNGVDSVEIRQAE
ncbi:DUF4956 domain-containing protein [Isosphaeraceae bacterium EP7]